MKKDPFFEARLLSERKQLTVQEKESILDAVVAEVRSTEGGARPPFLKSLPMPVRIVALAAVVVVVAVPAFILLSPPAEDGEFVARGGEGTPLSNFSVRCVEGGADDICRKGDKLVFSVRAPDHRPYFASFARHVPSQSVIWYFPDSETATSPSVRDISKDGVLSQGIRIGDEHAVGRYEVFGLFFDKPLHRAEIRGLFNDQLDPKDGNFTVAKVTFTVEIKEQ